MLSEKNYILKQFETEVWLYLDNSLSDERMKFWDEQISKNTELKKIIDETGRLLDFYNSEQLSDIDDPVFNAMLQKATLNKNSHKFLNAIKQIFGFNSDNELSIPKIAFASTLALAALIMLLLNDKPNQVKAISNELLDWDAGSITKQMNEIETGISLVDQDNYQRYMILKIQNEEWDKDIYSISKDLEKLKNDLKETSM